MKEQVHGTTGGLHLPPVRSHEGHRTVVLLLVLVQLVLFCQVAMGGKQKAPVPQAGSQVTSPGLGRITSTMASIRLRG